MLGNSQRIYSSNHLLLGYTLSLRVILDYSVGLRVASFSHKVCNKNALIGTSVSVSTASATAAALRCMMCFTTDHENPWATRALLSTNNVSVLKLYP